MGGRLTLKAKGGYGITMVKQAPEDNHVKLTIKYHGKRVSIEKARRGEPSRVATTAVLSVAG
jgi:hypothetical protein